MQTILITDDNKQISSILKEYAKMEGFTPYLAASGEEALQLFKEKKPDIILLDVMMPGMDGFEVCRQIRRNSSVPIIMVTARGEDFEKIMGLDIGADDYIVKPFSPSEVMARVRAVLRRIAKTNDVNKDTLKISNLDINLSTYTVQIDANPVVLTKREIELLWTLASYSGKAFSRDNLLDSLWGYDYVGDARTVDSHIKRLRAKLDAYEHPDWEIKTIWGVGYKFEVHA